MKLIRLRDAKYGELKATDSLTCVTIEYCSLVVCLIIFDHVLASWEIGPVACDYKLWIT